jgi:hypothetical protein
MFGKFGFRSETFALSMFAKPCHFTQTAF